MAVRCEYRRVNDMPGRRRPWILRSPAGPGLALAISIVLGIGAAFAAAVAVAALIREQPAPHAAWLLIPGIPLVAVGQLWMITVIRSRMPPRSGRSCSRQSSLPSSLSPRRFFFGSLGARPASVLFAAAIGGWLLAVTAFPTLANGGPGGHSATCAYVLSNHGRRTCVSRSAYQRAGAAEQRFAAGILLGFLCLQCGAALGGRSSTNRSRIHQPV